MRADKGRLGNDSATETRVDHRSAHAIHTSLIRPVLLAGAEPAVVIVETCVVFALLFVVGIHLVTIAIALFWLTVVHSVMVWVAKQEPQMTALYVRSLSARDFYAPLARANVQTPASQPAIPALR
jgi:type IV secretory pathway TrbD component